MGVVVAAMHLELDKLVALKFMHEEMSANALAGDRFLREARAAARLNNEHVGRRLSTSARLPDGVPYIVMEYLEGKDLSGKVLQTRGPLPRSRGVAEYALQVCEAMAEAHAQGIVHRDLKPQNLFLTTRPDGRMLVKVLDFGISKSQFARGGPTTTQQTMGSPLYMSPEQMRSARTVDSRADIWSIGVIIYELLSGQLPFAADTLPELLLKVMSDPPIPLDQVRRDFATRNPPHRHALPRQGPRASIRDDRRAGGRARSIRAGARAGGDLADRARARHGRAAADRRRAKPSSIPPGVATTLGDGPVAPARRAVPATPAVGKVTTLTEGSGMATGRTRVGPATLASAAGIAVALVVAIVVFVRLSGGSERDEPAHGSASGTGAIDAATRPERPRRRRRTRLSRPPPRSPSTLAHRSTMPRFAGSPTRHRHAPRRAMPGSRRRGRSTRRSTRLHTLLPLPTVAPTTCSTTACNRSTLSRNA